MVATYDLALVVHILASIVLVGHSLGVPATRWSLMDASTLGQLRQVAAFDRRRSRWNPPAAFVSLASGVYLGHVGWWGQGWFYVSIVQWVACSVLAVRVIDPVIGRLAGAAAGEGPVTPAADALRRSAPLAAAMYSDLANNLSLLYLMVMKPSTLVSVLIVALTNGLFLGLALARRRAGAPSSGAVAVR
jgi:uncharacterized membrane protein